jgi:hypothetical protein
MRGKERSKRGSEVQKRGFSFQRHCRQSNRLQIVSIFFLESHHGIVKVSWAGRVVQVVEHQPSRQEVLVQIPLPKQQKKIKISESEIASPFTKTKW